MRIGIIGSGNIGSTTARLFVEAGHEVAIANSRGPQTLTGLVGSLGERARAATAEQAAEFGQVVVVAIPFGRYRNLPAEQLAGKIVADATNYYPARDGNIPALDSDRMASSQLLASRLDGASVVKVFNTMTSGTLASGGRPDAPMEQRLAIYVAADDPDAKKVVGDLVDQIGFAPVDSGSLADSRRQQPGSPVYGADLRQREGAAALRRG
ncbi:MAG TPA: NAD(P)-binding domain-containing protein [Actinomycetota bacterium]|nr:NAD(P)-binding domain-containing protein [Actinomycetota bacterium]